MAGRRRSAHAVVPGKAAARRSRGRTREGATFPVAPPRLELPRDYAATLTEIKGRVQEERLRVVLAANSAMVFLYWDIGRMILDRQDCAGWGAKIIDRLAADLREAFPEMRGFSPRNLKYMREFDAALPVQAFVQQLAAQIPSRRPAGHRASAVPREEQGRGRVRAAALEAPDRRRRLGDEARGETPEGPEGELADGGGNRGGGGRRGEADAEVTQEEVMNSAGAKKRATAIAANLKELGYDG